MMMIRWINDDVTGVEWWTCEGTDYWHLDKQNDGDGYKTTYNIVVEEHGLSFGSGRVDCSRGWAHHTPMGVWKEAMETEAHVTGLEWKTIHDYLNQRCQNFQMDLHRTPLIKTQI